MNYREVSVTEVHGRVGPWRRVISGVLQWVSLIVTCLVLMTGCLVNRMVELKRQSCDFSTHFEWSEGQHASISLLDPVLVEQDMARLLGADPSHRAQSVDGEIHDYVFEKSGAVAPGEVLVLAFHYEERDGINHLRKIDFPATFNLFLDRQRIENLAVEVCAASLLGLIRGADQPIDPEQVALIPAQKSLISWLGLPSELVDGGRGLVYEYRLSGANSATVLTRFTLWYDAEGKYPLRMQSRFRETQVEADFEQMVMRMTKPG